MRAWLREIRLEKGFSEAKAAKLAGIAQPFYHNIEKGSKNPSVDTAKKIADVFAFPWTDFFESQRKEGKGRDVSGDR